MKRTPNRSSVLTLAALLTCDPRTAEKILRDGPDAIRTRELRERARRAVAELLSPEAT